GWDTLRALKWFFGHWLVGAATLWLYDLFFEKTGVGFVKIGAVSLSNSLPFLGLNRGPLQDAYTCLARIPLFNGIWLFQALFGTILLFFLLLTIRNRFRLK
ncbi:MAG: hypothetical protein ACR2OJ_16930, partial [Hyphomicrobiales bacterium]